MIVSTLLQLLLGAHLVVVDSNACSAKKNEVIVVVGGAVRQDVRVDQFRSATDSAGLFVHGDVVQQSDSGAGRVVVSLLPASAAERRLVRGGATIYRSLKMYFGDRFVLDVSVAAERAGACFYVVGD